MDEKEKIVNLENYRAQTPGIDTHNTRASNFAPSYKDSAVEIEFLDYNVDWLYDFELTIEGITLRTNSR
jgi:hypothetical protein